MADQADSLRIDLLLFLEEGDPRFDVGSVGLDGGVLRVACGLSDAAIIDAQYGDAFTCQVVGYDEKGLVAEDRLVAVLRARTGDEQHHRVWTISFGKGQRSAELGVVGGIVVEDLALFIRERRFRRLRSVAKRVGICGRTQKKADNLAVVIERELGIQHGRLEYARDDHSVDAVGVSLFYRRLLGEGAELRLEARPQLVEIATRHGSCHLVTKVFVDLGALTFA